MLARGYLVSLIQRSVGKNNNTRTSLKTQRQFRKCIFRTCSVAVNRNEDDDSQENKINLVDKLKKFKIQEKVDNKSDSSDHLTGHDEEYDNHKLGRHNRYYNAEDRHHSHHRFSRFNGPENRFRNKFSKPGRFVNRYREPWDDEDDPREHDSQYGFKNNYGKKQEKTPGFYQENSFSSRYSYTGGRNTQFVFEKPERDLPDYKPFEKDFYKEKESVQNRTEDEVLEFLDEHNITSYGKNVLRPVTAFNEAGFADVLNSRLMKEKWDAPTPIQSVTWPQALAGKDVVGIAQTGSGKTLGFMMPAFEHILHQEPLQRGDGPICLVLVPTRELCQQVTKIARDFGYVSRIRSCAVYGGAGRHPQIAALQRGSEICVATPGRLNDLLSSGVTSLDRCTYLVLDEADRMLDMGFEPQIRQIISQIRPDRQTLMWSATWPKEVKELARDYLKDYVQINVGSTELIANKNISQEVIVCEQHEKPKKFNEIMDKIMMSPDDEKVLIFTETKSMADELSRRIYRRGIHNVCIHGDKSQLERDRCLNAFSTGRVCVMVATDVCARGLDVSDITCVVNYDFPRQSTEDYIHRIGRTGRAGNKGKAITLFTSDNQNHAFDLIKVLQQTEQEIPSELKMIRYPSPSNKSKRPSKYGRYMHPRERGSFRVKLQKREGFASGFTKMDNEY